MYMGKLPPHRAASKRERGGGCKERDTHRERDKIKRHRSSDSHGPNLGNRLSVTVRQFKPDESGQTLSQINNARSPCHLAHRLYSFNKARPHALLAYRLVAFPAE